jgi:membrane-associated phospholipid phosphatase
MFLLLAIAIAVHPAPLGLEGAVDRGALAVRGSDDFRLFKAITITGSTLVVAIGAAGLAVECWIRLGDRRLAIACVVATGLAGIAETVLKPVVARPRPPTRVLTGETGFGFPSGHTTGATALAICAIAVFVRLAHTRRAQLALVIAATGYLVIIGVSRVVLGAHRGLDVVGGWLLGAAIAITVLLISRWDLRACTRTEAPTADGGLGSSPV